MKNYFKILLTLLILASSNIYSQNDSIFVMKKGKIAAQFKLSEIDSIIFYHPEIISAGTDSILMDGKYYHQIQIGQQIWMQENLAVSYYNDGTTIPEINDNTVWSTTTSGAYCWYKSGVAEKADFGAFYNWPAVNTQKLCPTGWHVPTLEDMNKLIGYLGGSEVSGGKLKDAGTIHWSAPNTDATNSSGFTATAAGYRDQSGSFGGMYNYNTIWLSTAYDINYSYSITLKYSDGKIMTGPSPNNFGKTVRCIKD